MTELPGGWAWTTIGELGAVMLGRQRAPRYHHGHNMRPYLRVRNVFEDRIDLTDVMEMDFSPDEFERYKLEPGDILLNEGQSPELVGRPAMYRGELPGSCFTNSLIRFRAGVAVEPLFALYLFRYYLHWGRFQREARITTNIAHLSASRFSAIEVALPPLAEQRRIVAAIEEHLSRLDAADANLESGRRRLATLRDSVLDSLVDSDWPLRPLGELLREPLRNGVSAKASPTGSTRIITLTAVTTGEFTERNSKLADLDMSRTKGLWLEPGDVLIERSNTPELVGTAALFGGSREWAIFPDLLIRVRPSAELLPEYLNLVLSTPKVRRYFQRTAQGISGSMPKIDQGDVLGLAVPTPPIDEQERAVEEVTAALAACKQLESASSVAKRQSTSLRRSILARAFRGELVPQDSDDEPASALLERFAASRGTVSPSRRRRVRASA